MGSSYYPSSGSGIFTAPTGPTGPTGSTGSIGPTGYGVTGNTGPSISGLGICGDKLRTYFDNGFTYETSSPLRGATGDVAFLFGISTNGELSVYSGFSFETSSFNFRKIRGATSSSGRAEITVDLLTEDTIKIEYFNSSSDFGIAITGASAINTFVGYSGNTLISLPKTYNEEYSSFAGKNVIEKVRGLGFSGATSSSNLPCNYITGGTFFYVNTSGISAEVSCKLVNITPSCVSTNSVDLGIKGNFFVADMQQNVTLVKIDNSQSLNYASAISVLLMNANNGPTAISVGQKRFQITDGNILWPFNAEPCFCGNTGTNLYHFYSLGGSTWYGSVAFLSDISKFNSCQRSTIMGLSVQYGACCIGDGTLGGTCSYETLYDCLSRGRNVFWHAGLTCGSAPCAKTGGCCLSFTVSPSTDSSICLDGITCTNCISGMVYDSEGKTFNAYSFTYLGNGVTCSASNCPAGA